MNPNTAIKDMREEMKDILIQKLSEVRKKLHEIEEQEEDILKELDALEKNK